MEKIKEILRTKVVRAFNEYKDYVELTSELNKERKETLKEVQEIYKENQDDDEVVDFTFDIFMVDAFHNRDIEILGTRFVHYLTLYKEIPDVEELDEEIETTYEAVKDNVKEQAFVVNKGKFEEIRKGFVDERRKVFDDKDLFNKLRGELEKIL